MKPDFVPVEKELALEAWMIQTFNLLDKLLEEDLVIKEWMRAEIHLFELN